MPASACQPVALDLAAVVRYRNVLAARNIRCRLAADVWRGPLCVAARRHLCRRRHGSVRHSGDVAITSTSGRALAVWQGVLWLTTGEGQSTRDEPQQGEPILRIASVTRALTPHAPPRPRPPHRFRQDNTPHPPYLHATKVIRFRSPSLVSCSRRLSVPLTRCIAVAVLDPSRCFAGQLAGEPAVR